MRWPVVTATLFVCLLAILLTGCGSKAANEAPVVASSPTEFVNKSFVCKPFGSGASKYKPDSAKATGEKVRFEDMAGGKYEVAVMPVPGTNSFKFCARAR